MKPYSINSFVLCALILTGCSAPAPVETKKSNTYPQLVGLFQGWREFQAPPMSEGVPDYSNASMKKQHDELKSWQQKLQDFDTTGWPIKHQIDWHLVFAEMNGLDFDHRVVQPWERDPAFYKTLWMDRSDVPAHEGPTHSAILDLWKYSFPLTSESKEKLVNQIHAITLLNEQAKVNLTGNAKDLWIAGIRDIKTQSLDLENILTLPGVSDQPDVISAVSFARTPTFPRPRI